MAAVISYQLRIGVEYALRNYVPEQVGPFWTDLARDLVRTTAEQMTRAVEPPKFRLQ